MNICLLSLYVPNIAEMLLSNNIIAVRQNTQPQTTQISSSVVIELLPSELVVYSVLPPPREHTPIQLEMFGLYWRIF